MLNDLMNVIYKILNNQLIELDEELRNNLKEFEDNYLDSAKKEVLVNNETQDIYYKIPELEAYKNDPKNPSKVLILDIQNITFGLGQKIVNWIKRRFYKHIFNRDIAELVDSHEIPMKEYFIEMYKFMIEELNECNQRINELKNVYYGESQTRLKLVENRLQELKSIMEKAEKEDDAVEVITKLKDLKSSKKGEIKRMKDEIKKHKQYTEQALPSRSAR